MEPLMPRKRVDLYMDTAVDAWLRHLSVEENCSYNDPFTKR
jgi:hypothetical protein